MDRVYVQDLRWLDLGAAAAAREKVVIQYQGGLAAERVPELAHILTFADVPAASHEYKAFYAENTRLVRAREEVRRAEQIVALMANFESDAFTGFNLSPQRTHIMRSTQDGKKWLAELSRRRTEVYQASRVAQRTGVLLASFSNPE